MVNSNPHEGQMSAMDDLILYFSILLLCTCAVQGKVYSRCALAKELQTKYKLNRRIVPSILCLSKFGAKYDTSSLSNHTLDGSRDHGLFQINDGRWCSSDDVDDKDGDNECNIPCHKLRDHNIDDDVRCLRRIMASRGFPAWATWNDMCKGTYMLHYLQGC
ncbi:Sperm acrosome-associated protein 5 [Halotydeus destructor]|nr:Sperm acrosome-associated protein 5 [Halotydeus destructor]